MWKRLFFFLVIVVIVLVVAVGYLWRRATAPPSWYQEQRDAAIELSEPATLEQARRELAAKLRPVDEGDDSSPRAGAGAADRPAAPDRARDRRSARGRMELRLDEREVGRLLATSLAAHDDGRKLLGLSRGLGARLEDGRLEVGMMVRLPRESDSGLSVEEREIAREIAEHVSFLAGREVFVAVSGRPAPRDGRLGLEDPRLQVGPLKLSGADLADRLGIDRGELERGVDLEWGRLRDVQVQDGELLLELER